MKLIRSLPLILGLGLVILSAGFATTYTLTRAQFEKIRLSDACQTPSQQPSSTRNEEPGNQQAFQGNWLSALNWRSVFGDILLSTPEQVILAERTYTLDAFLNRDFIPSPPSDTKPMLVSIRLQSQDSNLASSPLIPDRLWLIRRHDQAIWETQLTNEPRINSGAVQMVARNGPLWEPGTVVDVVVRVPISDQEFCLVRSPNQTIQRSE